MKTTFTPPPMNVIFDPNFIQILSEDKTYTLFYLVFQYSQPARKLRKIVKEIILGKKSITVEQKYSLKKFENFLTAYAFGQESAASRKIKENCKGLCKLLKIYLENEKHERASTSSHRGMGKSKIIVKSKRNEKNNSSKNRKRKPSTDLIEKYEKERKQDGYSSSTSSASSSSSYFSCNSSGGEEEEEEEEKQEETNGGTEWGQSTSQQ